MDENDDFLAWPGELELRQRGGARQLRGRFPYGKRAVISDRARVRKEMFRSGSFSFSLNDETRKIDLLVGHDFGKPIANRQTGSLVLTDSEEALTFIATLSDDAPTWVLDAEKAIRNGTMTGLSPGFRVPPKDVVPNAERYVAEEGNPGVMIREINDAVLREFSVVTAGAYDDAYVDLRAEGNAVLVAPRSVYEWL